MMELKYFRLDGETRQHNARDSDFHLFCVQWRLISRQDRPTSMFIFTFHLFYLFQLCTQINKQNGTQAMVHTVFDFYLLFSFLLLLLLLLVCE